MGAIRDFMNAHYLHFNAREVVDAAKGYVLTNHHVIQQGKVHAISCTGANLEEDIFNLVAHDEYEIVPSWRELSPEDEQALYDRGMNRVTDTCIPESVMRHIEQRLLALWQKACEEGRSHTPAGFLFQLLDDPSFREHYQIDPAHSWMVAAKEMGIPVFAPGWEDSTTGNIFAANVMLGNVSTHACVKSGTEQFQQLIEWYEENHGGGERPSVGFFQIGGGIAGDFAICAVPCIIQDLKRDVPFWGYFSQITDAQPSYGGYSGAPATEKITWGKLEASTPRFNINSDAMIVAPLIFAYVLND